MRPGVSTCQRWIEPMPSENPMPRLREIRDIQNSAQELTPERNRLIRKAAELDHSQGEIAVATGLDQTRIGQILRSDLLTNFVRHAGARRRVEASERGNSSTTGTFPFTLRRRMPCSSSAALHPAPTIPRPAGDSRGGKGWRMMQSVKRLSCGRSISGCAGSRTRRPSFAPPRPTFAGTSTI